MAPKLRTVTAKRLQILQNVSRMQDHAFLRHDEVVERLPSIASFGSFSPLHVIFCCSFVSWCCCFLLLTGIMATPAAAKKHSKLDKQVRSPSTCCQDLTDNHQRKSLRGSISSMHHLRLPRILDHVSSKYSRAMELASRPGDIWGRRWGVSHVQPDDLIASLLCPAWAQI